MISDGQKYTREAWVKELRTTTVPQATEQLVKNVAPEGEEPKLGYCCLGIAERYVSNGQPEQRPSGDYRLNGQTAVLSAETQVRLGFLSDNPYMWFVPAWLAARIRGAVSVPIEDPALSRYEIGLAGLNDDIGLTFREIADVIDAQPEDWTGVNPHERLIVEGVNDR